MANATRANKIYVDSTGLASASRTKIAYILFTPAANNDSIVLRETADDVDVLKIAGSVAHQTTLFRLGEVPMVFGNGVYVQSLSSGAVATLVTTSTGG